MRFNVDSERRTLDALPVLEKTILNKVLGQPRTTIPVLIATVIIGGLALWALGMIPGGQDHGAKVKWNVEYWHQNAEGEVLAYKKDSNAIVASGLEHAMERLIAAQSPSLAFTNPAAAEIGEANAFDQIVLMNTDDPATGGLAAANILLLVDGGTGNNAGQAAGGNKWNPADGAYLNVGTGTDGDGKVTLQFLADGDPVAATQMHLVKAGVDNTGDGAVLINAVDILATIEISVDLADTDTLTVTWTLDID